MGWLPRNIIAATQLTNAVATYYTVPDKTKTTIKKLTLTNTTGAAVTVVLYLVPRSGTAGVSNRILDTVNVPAHGSRPVDVTEVVDHVMEQGDFIQAVASAASAITIRASGLELS
jgi:hypothetical protein